MYAQVISDESGATLTAVSTLTAELRSTLKKTATIDAAKEVGSLIARKCQEKESPRSFLIGMAFCITGASVRLLKRHVKPGCNFKE